MLPCHRLNNLRLWKFEHEIIQWDITYCLKPEFPHLSKQLFPISLSFNQSIDLQQHYIQTKIRLFFFFCWLRRTNDEFIVCRHARPQNHNRNTTKTKSDTHKLLNVGCVQMSCGRSGTITVCICIERKEKKKCVGTIVFGCLKRMRWLIRHARKLQNGPCERVRCHVESKYYSTWAFIVGSWNKQATKFHG